MTTLTLEDAQTRLTDVVRQLSVGEEVMITDGNCVVARIVGESKPAWQRPEPGLAKGMLTILAKDDEPLKDFAEYMPRTSWPILTGTAASPRPGPGLCKGAIIYMAPDFDAPLEDLKEYME